MNGYNNNKIIKRTKSTNYGKGFWYEFLDGYSGWILGMSASERRYQEKIHGRLIKWKAV